MFVVILGAIILGLLYLTYACYFRPINEQKRMAKLLTDLGYKVFVAPYKPMLVYYISEWKRGLKEHGDSLYNEKYIYPKYDVALEYIFNRVAFTAIIPQINKQFFTPDKIDHHIKPPQYVAAFKMLRGKALLLSEHDEWRRKRKIINKSFSYDLVISNFDNVCRIMDQVFDQMEQTSKNENGSFSCYLIQIFGYVFSRVIIRCFFGIDNIDGKIRGMKISQFLPRFTSDCILVGGHPLVNTFGSCVIKWGLTQKFRQVRDDSKAFFAICTETFLKRKKQIQQNPSTTRKSMDLLEDLLRQQNVDKDDFQPYTDQDIVQDFIGFLNAGSDTTSNFLTMIIYYLCLNPRVETQLRKKVSEVIKTDSDITHDNLKKITYIDWIQYQTTRHYGPVPSNFARQAKNDHLIGNIPIPKGMILGMKWIPNHYNQKYFKDPFEFRPERWQSECRDIDPFAFMGFSSGVRACIGKQLAHLQSKLCLVKLLRRYEKFQIPKKQIRMISTFLYEPEKLITTLYKTKQQ